MANRLKYFQTAKSDIAHLRRAFAYAYDDVLSLYPKTNRKRDARITVFSKCLNVSLSVDAGLSLFVSQLLNKERFSQMIEGDLKDKDMRHIQDEFQQFLKMAAVNAFYVAIESSFRIYVKVADPQFTATNDSFHNLYAHTLKKLDLKKYVPVLDLFRLLRNTFHTNGYHNAKNARVLYNGKYYDFIRGQTVNFLTWSFLAVLLYDIREMLLAIVKTKPFADAEYIEEVFTGFDWPETLD